jgi:hypothetical protein
MALPRLPYNRCMGDHKKEDPLVVAHTAGSLAEALVIRGLLTSNGIFSPDPTSADPFPLSEPLEGALGTEIFAPASQAEEARRIIDAYRKKPGSASAAAE